MFDYSFCIPNMYFKSANRYLEKEIQHEKMYASILQNMTLDELLDTESDGKYHVKEMQNGYEYRLSNLSVEDRKSVV